MRNTRFDLENMTFSRLLDDMSFANETSKKRWKKDTNQYGQDLQGRFNFYLIFAVRSDHTNHPTLEYKTRLKLPKQFELTDPSTSIRRKLD